jgi:hypothetical protein
MNGGPRTEVKRHSTVGVGNWVGTIILSLIPGVNIVSFIIWIVAGKVPSKRNFAIGALIVSFLLVLAYLVVIMFFADPVLRFLTDATGSLAGV